MKPSKGSVAPSGTKSHPARGAWIETLAVQRVMDRMMSHPARGAWIETDGV